MRCRCGRCVVNVPVLSRNSRCIVAKGSSASMRRSSTPRCASACAAASNAAGVARDSAQGQVTISTDTATQIARGGSITLHATPPAAARTNTAQRNGPAQRSAQRAAAGRCVAAPCIKPTIAS